MPRLNQSLQPEFPFTWQGFPAHLGPPLRGTLAQERGNELVPVPVCGSVVRI